MYCRLRCRRFFCTLFFRLRGRWILLLLLCGARFLCEFGFRRFLHKIVAVVAEILRDPAVFQLKCAIRRLIKKITIMRNSDKGARKRHQRLLHCFACRDVKVVRRLVQHKEVRARQHEFQKCDACLFPARKCADQA